MQHIKIIEKFLKNEISATETYQQALDKFKEEAGVGGAEALMPLFEEHKGAVACLEALNTSLEGETTMSGAWGAWAKIVLSTANLLGKEAVLTALLEGEKSGAADYESALEEAELRADIRALIQNKLLPAQRSHIQALEELLETEAT